MSKLEQQKALPRRRPFKAADQLPDFATQLREMFPAKKRKAKKAKKR